ncbi:MAG: UDP-N-acetylglucosamine-peptide N-acetylglucosaminyltransferase [Methylocella sp.]
MKSIGRKRGMCEWDGFTEAAPHLRGIMARGESGRLAPFHLLSEPGVTASEQRACSELWIRDRLAAARPECANLDFRFDRGARTKIRLGYLSSDFQDHATALLLIETLEAHDRARFDVRAYSYGADDGRTMRKRLQKTFDAFSDVAGLTDVEAARAIHADGIDILVDLKGYTLNARTGILLLHPAPVQVNYLGYPGTLGADVCDYLVTDRFITPPGSAADYSESFAYMPHSYQPHGRGAALAPKPGRAEMGLPATGFVFCSFNQHYKLTPELFGLWCRLLQCVPDSVLWLIDGDAARGNLRNEALRRGVSPHRLVFAPDMAQAGHLARLQLADLVLDTAPCGAHTTASDALWAGAPIVTCPGDTFASRVAGSLLHASGLKELIAADLDGYFDLALDLATNPQRLGALRARLERNRATCALFDVRGYTADLENMYEVMWRRRQAGLPAAPIG